MKISDGSVCVGQAVYEEYIGVACSQRSVPSQTFKRLVTTYTHRNNERVGIFKGIQYVNEPTTSECPINDISKISSHWFKLDHNDVSGAICVATKTNIEVEGIPVMKEVTIDKHFNVSVKIGTLCVDHDCVGLPCNLKDTSMSFERLIQIIDESEVCTSKEVPYSTHLSTVWSVDGHKSHRKHSKSCFGIMPVLCRGSTCRSCHSHSVRKFSDENNNNIHEHVNLEEHLYEREPLDDSKKEALPKELFPNCNE